MKNSFHSHKSPENTTSEALLLTEVAPSNNTLLNITINRYLALKKNFLKSYLLSWLFTNWPGKAGATIKAVPLCPHAHTLRKAD